MGQFKGQLDAAAMSQPLLNGEVALITGGASGLGLAIARRFVDEGAKVALFDISSERLEEAAQALGSEALTIQGDVRSMIDNERAVQKCVERFGQLSIFVGNAGIYDQRTSLTDIPFDKLESAFNEIFSINVMGYMLGAKAAVPELERSRGTIVFTTSVSGLNAGFGGFLYVAAKHAITGLTRQLAIELAPNIRVNAVAPGYVPTRLAGLQALDHGESKSGAGRTAEQFLLRTIPAAEDYTFLYAVVASRTNSAVMTGTVLLADGGASLRTP